MTVQNQKGLDSPKKSLKSRSRPPSILKVLYPCNEANSQSDFTKQYQQIISKSNKQIGDEETINISDNLQSYENATTNNNNSNSSNLNFELAKCYKQLASNLTMQMIGAAGGGNNDQQNRNYNHQRTSLDQRAMHPNHLIQEMYLNMNGRNIYNTDEDQETFQNFESKLQNLLEQGQQIDQQYNAFVSELTNQLVSRKSLQTKQEGSQINVSSSHKKRLVERLSKFIQMDSHFKKIFLNTSLGNGGGGGGAVANVDSQFSVIMDRMKKYIFYFPQNNYEKVIRQHNQYLYKIKRENQGKNYISFRNKRRNIILQNPQIYNQQQKGFLNNLAIETKLKRIPDMPFQQNPTNLSYGISIRGCSKTPIKFNQLN